MTNRWRVLVLAVLCAVAVGVATGYILHARSAHEQAIRDAPTLPSTTLASVSDRPRIVFRNTALGSTYGMVSEVALGDPAGPRATTATSCDRVYAAGGRILCLASDHGVVTTYSATVLDDALHRVRPLRIEGIPSRARLSPDGRYAATTTFVAGDSYAGTSFSTRTTITALDGSTAGGDLEDFTLRHDGATIRPVGRNFWGVTFARDDTTFYATVAWSGHTWLARGDLRTRTVTTLHEDAECPSLSPDGSRIVFKQRGSRPPGRWRLVEYDVGTGRVTPLAETRSVDDQVDWLDDDHVVYGLPRNGSQAAVDDVWEVPADGTGTPRLLIPQAWSPAVVR